MLRSKAYSFLSLLLVFQWCTLSAVLSYTNQQIRASKEESDAKPYFRDEKLTLPIFEEQSINCTNNYKKGNERYTSSFTELDEELSIVKDPKQAIKEISNDEGTNSIRLGEATTLCWIERIIIKEDLSFEPPKRLVFKEYAISFENSATIPDDYLDCKKIKGEISSNDTAVGKTVFYEIIDENTKVSKVVNFTRVRNENGIRIWQHKSVKCGMGSVVSKSLTEWDVDSKNPQKRLEIKVGPMIHSLKAASDKTKPTWSSVTSTETVHTSDVNVSDNVVGRIWLTDTKLSSEDFKFDNNHELQDRDFKSEEFIKNSTKIAGHPTTDAMEVIEIVDHTTVLPMEPTTSDEISSITWKNINQTKLPMLPREKFVLKIKLLLEHTNEKENKESLVVVEKNVVLTGNETRFGQADFLEQVKTLNRSINLEVIEALFNYTSLGEFTKFNNISLVTERSSKIKKRSNIEEENKYSEKTVEEVNGVLYADMTGSRMADDFWYNEIGYNLPDIYEDVTMGLGHMFSIFTDRNDSLKSRKSKSFDITENSNPVKSYIRRKRNTIKEVGRWWKERTDYIYIGGHIRSITELTLYQI